MSGTKVWADVEWPAVMGYYRAMTMGIYAAGKTRFADDDPYHWSHSGGIDLSPEELVTWGDIMGASIVMYPRYPVGDYFVDFANPVARVAIDCGGAAFGRDAVRSVVRSADLQTQGWKVHRVHGWMNGIDVCRMIGEVYGVKASRSYVDRNGVAA